MLGVQFNASQTTIKVAYRDLSKILHPDVNHDPDAAERLKAVTEAYEVLSDPDRRKQYDKTRATGDPGLEYPPPSAPYEVAHKIYRDHALGDMLINLLAWRGGWMAWRTTHWVEIDAAELRQAIYAALSKVFYWQETPKTIEKRAWSPNKHKVIDVLEALAAVVHTSSEVDPPAWLKNGLNSALRASHHGNDDAGQTISCRNGLLDLGTRKLVKHTPALFNLVSVPFDYEPNAPEPVVWLSFLASLWGDDHESIALLQEYFGYVLSGRLDMQKLLMLVGPIRSGKGTISRTLAKLMGGRRNVAAPTLASLGTNFGLSSLLGKPLAIISDARLGNTPSHVVVERLLSITGEDMIDVDRKFREVWTGKLPSRFVILSNELPKFKDSSGAIATRMLILRMSKSFLHREDHELDAKLAPELGGILSWALEGLERLNRKGRFTVPQSSRDDVALMMDLASPTSAFVRERCVRAPEAVVTRDDLYAAWKIWAESNGHHPGAKSTFGRDLRSVVPEVKDYRTRTGGRQTHSYASIGLLPDSPDSPDEYAVQDVAADTVDPDSRPGSQITMEYESTGESGSPGSADGIKPLLNARESGESGKATSVSPSNGFVPPAGPTCGVTECRAIANVVGICAAKVVKVEPTRDAANAPRGGITDATPGYTARVQDIVARCNGGTQHE